MAVLDFSKGHFAHKLHQLVELLCVFCLQLSGKKKIIILFPQDMIV